MPIKKAPAKKATKKVNKKETEEMKVNAQFRINYPDSASIFQCYGNYSFDDKSIAELIKAYKEKTLVEIYLGVRFDGEIAFNLNEVDRFSRMIIPVEYIQSIRRI